MLTHFDSKQFSASDRIASWRDAVARSLVDVDCQIPKTTQLSGEFDTLTSGGLGLAHLSASGHSASRSKASISRSGDDSFMLFLQRMGRMEVSVGDRLFEVEPVDFFFYDARQPHCMSFDGQFDHIALKFRDVTLSCAGGIWAHVDAFA
jgi:AraC-binding-like domain